MFEWLRQLFISTDEGVPPEPTASPPSPDGRTHATANPPGGVGVAIAASRPERYSRPIICAIDLPTEAINVLVGIGLHVDRGTLGSVHKVQKKVNSVVPVGINLQLPEAWTESDILVVDLATRDSGGGPQTPPEHSLSWWVSMSHGVVDPRPLVLRSLAPRLDLMRRQQKLIVVFAGPAQHFEYEQGYIEHGSFTPRDRTGTLTTWEPLVGHWLSSAPATGRDIKLPKDVPERLRPLAQAILTHREDFAYNCVLTHSTHHGELPFVFAPLAHSHHSETIAAILIDKKTGCETVILPQVKREAHTTVLKHLFGNVLPSIYPQHFPEHHHQLWLQNDLYRDSRATQLERDAATLLKEASLAAEGLKARAAKFDEAYKIRRSLLTASGDTLVAAVKDALEHLGFTPVVDLDATMAEAPDANRREDLQVMDERYSALLIEVKGIFGTPEEAEALQVAKYIAPRMREWKRTDVRGLFVVNHQRSIAPHQRDHMHLFQEAVLLTAPAQHVGLLTTWDLFQLLRWKDRFGWPNEVIQPIFFRDGRISPIPDHYRPCGVVEDVYRQRQAFTILPVTETISVGSRLSIMVNGTIVGESRISSMQDNRKPIPAAERGANPGIQLDVWVDEIRKGAQLFLCDLPSDSTEP